MRLEYDQQADAVYIRLRDLPTAFSHNLDLDRCIDYGSDQRPVGVELLGVSHGVNLDSVPERDAITRLLEDHHIKIFA